MSASLRCAPPLLLRDVIAEPAAVVDLLERNAPYHPLGGWFRPDAGDAPTSPMWFQQDWVHADYRVEGADLFFENEAISEAARKYYDAEVVEPYALYVNLMAQMAECGPAHTDNPYFRGVDRTNAPMFFLRSMLRSGLFERWSVDLATSIWWLDDVKGGGLAYWADGPDNPPRVHVGDMANTALVGDNHGMFHQVQPVGAGPTVRVTPHAELVPNGSGSWIVRDRGVEVAEFPLDELRVSVLLKAYVYRSAEARDEAWQDVIDVPRAVEIFNRDLAERDIDLCLDAETLDAPGKLDALGAAYPEDVPIAAGRSIYDA